MIAGIFVTAGMVFPLDQTKSIAKSRESLCLYLQKVYLYSYVRSLPVVRNIGT